MKLRNLIIFLLIILIAIPITWYSIKKYRAGADIQSPTQNSTQAEPIPLAADLAMKQGTPERTDDPTKMPTLKETSPQDLIKANTLIVKMKEGKDIKSIETILATQNNIPEKKIIIKDSKPLIDQQRLNFKTQESIAKRPQDKSLIVTQASKINLDNIYLIQTESNQSIEAQLSRIENNPNVEYAQVNRKVHAKMVPNDPYYYSSAGSWGQDYDDLWGLKKIQTETAWDNSQGEDIIVAVTDTGIDYNHEDLSANIWTNQNEIAGNNIDDDNNGFTDDIHGYDFFNDDADPMDDHGHGTHVAGTIAAVGNNNLGVIGVAPKAKLIAVKGLDFRGSGYDTDLALAIIYAANNNAKVINASWGEEGVSEIVEDAVNYAHDIKGSVFVAAAGNDNQDLINSTPANLENAISVAATDHNDLRSTFSNWGNKLDISAPGGDSSGPGDTYVNILSARANNTDMYGDGQKIVADKYYRARGTSMAAPHVAGAAALIFKQRPEFSPRVVEKILYLSTDDLGTSGFDQYYGFGRVNTRLAMDLTNKVINDSIPPTKPTYPKAKALHTRQVDLSWQKSTDNTLVVGYKIFRNGTLIADVSDRQLIYSDTGLTQGTLYKYRIKAYDANNLSSAANISITTPTDSTPPTAPTNLTGMAFADRNELSWNPSTDNLYLAGYKIYRDGLEIADLPRYINKFIDYQVMTNSTFEYTIKAYDSEINYSNPSNILNLTTPEPSFVNSNIDFQALHGTAKAAWGDYDNDGDLDVAYVGRTTNDIRWNYGEHLIKVYRNDGNDIFTDVSNLGNNDFPDVSMGSLIWADFDNDSDLDLAINGTNFNVENYGITAVYRNDGNSQFSLYVNLQPLYWGSVDLGDVNNDGFLDIVVTGGQFDEKKSNLYIYYNRQGVIQNTDYLKLEGHREGEIKLVDYDNDGDLDITTYGYVWNSSNLGSRYFFEIYKNNGQGQFDINNMFSPDNRMRLGYSIALGSSWGDYDNDGDLDLIVSGVLYYSSDRYHTVIYNNNLGTFRKVFDAVNLQMNPEWGDYDNDGDLDLALTGNNTTNGSADPERAESKVLRNDGNNSFVDIGTEIPKIGGNLYYSPGGSSTWSDYDNDGDLDLLITGADGPEIKIALMKNLTADADHFNKPNQKPNPPINFNKKISGNNVTLSWNSGSTGRSDVETPEPGLYFNLRLGITPGGQEIISKTNSTPLLGNYLRPKFTAWLSPRLYGRKINNLPAGRYYWAVQTIDSGLKTSDWSPEQVFDIP